MHPRLLSALAVAALLTTPMFAQEGKITYNETIKIEIELPPEMEHMRDQIPSERTFERTMHFTPSATVMTASSGGGTHEVEISSDGGERRMRMDDGGAENVTFFDLENNKMVRKTDFLGRTFRIIGEREPISWKLTGSQSTFLGYQVMQATAERDSTVIEAWFAPELAVSGGPGEYGGLPGLILVLTIDEGQRSFEATSIEMMDVDDETVSPPDGGREVTQEEYDQIVAEKMEEMGMSGGRGNRAVIQIRRN